MSLIDIDDKLLAKLSCQKFKTNELWWNARKQEWVLRSLHRFLVNLGFNVNIKDAETDGRYSVFGVNYWCSRLTFSPYTYTTEKTYEREPARHIDDITRVHFFRKYNKPTRTRITKKNKEWALEATNELLEQTYLLKSIHSLPQDPDSNVFCIDIDVENALEEVYYPLKRKYFPNVREVLVECSAIGKAHIYIMLTKAFKDYGNFEVEFWFKGLLMNTPQDNFKKYCQAQDNVHHIEIRTPARMIRLPDSPSYQVGYIQDYKFIPYTEEGILWVRPATEGLKEIKSNTEYQLFIPPEVSDKVEKKEEVKVHPIEKKEEPIEYKLEKFIPEIPKGVPLYIRKEIQQTEYKEVKSTLWSREYAKMYSYRYGAGTRWNNCKFIVASGVRLGMTFDKILQATIDCNDGTSYTIAHNPAQHEKEMQGFYDYFSHTLDPDYRIKEEYTKQKKQFVPTGDFPFKSNLGILEQNKRLRRFVNREAYHIYNLIKDKHLTLNVKPSDKKEYRRAVFIVLQEMVSYCIYDVAVKKKKNPNNQYVDDNFFNSELLKGFQFSRTYLDKLKEHHAIKVDILKLFNVIVRESAFFKCINSQWSYKTNLRYCKQYSIKGITKEYKYTTTEDIVQLLCPIQAQPSLGNIDIDNKVLLLNTLNAICKSTHDTDGLDTNKMPVKDRGSG